MLYPPHCCSSLCRIINGQGLSPLDRHNLHPPAPTPSKVPLQGSLCFLALSCLMSSQMLQPFRSAPRAAACEGEGREGGRVLAHPAPPSPRPPPTLMLSSLHEDSDCPCGTGAGEQCRELVSSRDQKHQPVLWGCRYKEVGNPWAQLGVADVGGVGCRHVVYLRTGGKVGLGHSGGEMSLFSAAVTAQRAAAPGRKTRDVVSACGSPQGCNLPDCCKICRKSC